MSNKTREKTAGFSLIELAIALIVISFITTPLIMAYNAYLKGHQISETRTTLRHIRDAINVFIDANGRYPIPASLATVEGDPNHGVEGNPTPTACAGGWFLADGMCETASGVLIGAVPFDALGLDIKRINDYWGNRILYAITASRTNEITYNASAGIITVQVLDNARLPINYANDYDMVLLSFGGSPEGGISDAGAFIGVCVNATPEYEDENCDFDDVFLLERNPGDQFKDGTVSRVPGNGFYDDITLEQKQFPQDRWIESETNKDFAISNAQRIGIGTTNPQANVHVIGDVRADNVLSDSICDDALAGCFDPEIIAGDVADMDCGSNAIASSSGGEEPVLSIGNSRVRCAMAVNTAGTSVDPNGRKFKLNSSLFAYNTPCPLGERMIRFNSSGGAECAP
ncbi:MAG: type II secretion system protein [Rhodospirillales bacterium]|nr:type II secretion system protein [Rhodospirillales bacterium]MCB9995843.1 type II secretion system protein [Rhodospirillales bacterium]